MAVSAFNTPDYPQVWPIEGVTLDWFRRLFGDQQIIAGLQRSLLIGVLVVLISVPVGLAGAMMMTQLDGLARSYYYVFAMAPILTPGIVIGIATVVFWRDFAGLMGLRDVIYNGVILTTLAQSSFISSYCMLIILARLQRCDKSLEEAALDLGANNLQAFFHVLLPFLRPALLSAAALAFLSSFENYNTKLFSILADKTLTTVVASHARLGSSPVLSALSTVIVLVTIVGAVVYQFIKQRQETRLARANEMVRRAEREELGAPIIDNAR